jgi:hypothetical protein
VIAQVHEAHPAGFAEMREGRSGLASTIWQRNKTKVRAVSAHGVLAVTRRFKRTVIPAEGNLQGAGRAIPHAIPRPHPWSSNKPVRFSSGLWHDAGQTWDIGMIKSPRTQRARTRADSHSR